MIYGLTTSFFLDISGASGFYDYKSLWDEHFCISFVVTHLDIFANNLYDLQVKLLDWGSREVNVTQKTVDDLQQWLLHAGQSFLQQLKVKIRYLHLWYWKVDLSQELKVRGLEIQRRIKVKGNVYYLNLSVFFYFLSLTEHHLFYVEKNHYTTTTTKT